MIRTPKGKDKRSRRGLDHYKCVGRHKIKSTKVNGNRPKRPIYRIRLRVTDKKRA